MSHQKQRRSVNTYKIDPNYATAEVWYYFEQY